MTFVNGGVVLKNTTFINLSNKEDELCLDIFFSSIFPQGCHSSQIGLGLENSRKMAITEPYHVIPIAVPPMAEQLDMEKTNWGIAILQSMGTRARQNRAMLSLDIFLTASN
ncbi:hypothetical protein VU07_03165 [Desulfobulbus sp. F4]|nr:hypothetical protein [Desulfobulbus sp. F3]MCW5200798.1 hypothetical protein [Desulfobulbus sp. F4]